MRHLLISLVLLAIAISASSQNLPVPGLISYQGKLLSTSGAPVPDGNYSIRFSLWDAATAGTEKWNQAIVSVPIVGGLFTSALNVSTVPTLFRGNLWLEVKVGTSPALTPRQQLLTSPYAFKAASVVDGSITGASIANATITADKLAPGAGGGGWGLTGNAGTNELTSFVGTTDAKSLNLRANNRRVFRVSDAADVANTYHAVNLIGGAAINSVLAGVTGATIAGGGQDNNTGLDVPNEISGDFGTIGGGSGNAIDAFSYATISGGSGNNAQGNSTTIGGGTGNNTQSDYTTIAGGASNYVFGSSSTVSGGSNNSVSSSFSTIGGGDTNSATGSASAVAGGQLNAAAGFYSSIAGGFQNQTSGSYTTIGGGSQNEVTAFLATVAGGSQNKASGQYSNIGGGSRNIANADTATIAGGDENTVNGTFTTIAGGRQNYGWSISDHSTIGGGFSNTVYGDYATIPGGYKNYADGLASFAAGYRAYAAHDGSFVWGDAHEGDFASTAANQFCVRASNGIIFETFSHVPFYSGVGTTEANRYFMLLNSPRSATASGLKAGGILCADAFDYANPAKNNMVVKGTLAVGYPDPSPYRFAVAGTSYSLGGWSGSDSRWKQNVTDIDDPLGKVLRLRGVSFDWKPSEEMAFPEGRQIGFIAQELEQVLPDLVSTDPKGYKAVAYANLIPVVVEAIKTQQARIDKLEARNAQLEAQLADFAKLAAEIRAMKQ